MATSAQTGNALSAVFGDAVRKELVTILDGTANGSQTIPAGSNLTLTQGNATLASGNLTLTSGNEIITVGNLTLSSGNLALTAGGITLTNGNLTITTGGVIRTAYSIQQGGARCKVGSAAGWVVNAGNNIGTLATMANSQAAGTLIVPLNGLHVGDTITGFNIYASINWTSGIQATIDCDFRSLTIAAGATATDASITTMTQVTTASAALAATGTKTGMSTVITAGVMYYMKITGTTGAGSTIEIDNIDVVVTTA